MFVVSLIIGIITYLLYSKYYKMYVECLEDYDWHLSDRKKKKLKEDKYKYDRKSNVYAVICTIAFLIAGISFFIGLIMLGIGNYAKMAIPVYEEENIKIEEQINGFISKYTDYEKNTLKEFKPETIQLIVATYPELKTNELVNKQIDVYVKNNNKIKDLKEESNNYKIGKWLLYFG